MISYKIMLNLTNLPAVTQSSLQNQSESTLFLKVNQHIAGEVIRVENEQVILSIQGVQLVARMTTPEQTASLIEKRFAQFIVKDLSEGTLSLQLIDSHPSINQQSSSSVNTHLLSKLLDQAGIENTTTNQMIAQAAIRNGLTINSKLVEDLGSSLSKIPNWGMEHAIAAAKLKTNAISITPESINLMLNAQKDISGQVLQIIQQLTQAMSDRRLPENLVNLAKTSLQILNQAIVDASLPADVLAAKLHNAIILLGKSVENELFKTISDPVNNLTGNNLERGLMVLSRLRNELASRGMTTLSDGIDQFNDSIRLMHLYHSSTTSESASNQWIKLDLPVTFPATTPQLPQKPDDQPSASIRIARNPDDDTFSIDPQYTRLVIRMDIDKGDVIEVDFSIVDHSAGLFITTSNSHLTNIARNELPSLQKDLMHLGYDTKVSQVETEKKLLNTNHENTLSYKTDFVGINLEA
jgi:hypothetical protein